MAKRTMTISRLWYHPMRKRDAAGPVSDLPDKKDLLDLFEEFVDGVDPDHLVRKDTLSYVSLQSIERRGRALLIATESGRFGEKGSLKDVETHQPTGTFGENEATAVITHGVLLVPKVGTSALAFVERSAGQGGMTRLLDLFVPFFNARYSHNHLLERDAIVEKEAWIERANLVKVRATARSQLSDPGSDSKDQILGHIVHTIEPDGPNGVLPRWLWRRLRDNKVDRTKFLGLSEHTDPDELDVQVTLAGDGQSKTFEIGTEKTPTMKRVLTTSGESAFDKVKVLSAALDEAAEIFAEFGVEWSEADAVKPSGAN